MSKDQEALGGGKECSLTFDDVVGRHQLYVKFFDVKALDLPGDHFEVIDDGPDLQANAHQDQQRASHSGGGQQRCQQEQTCSDAPQNAADADFLVAFRAGDG